MYDFEQVSKLEIGDVFYECEGGRNLEMTVKTKPELKKTEDGEGGRNIQLSWISTSKSGKDVDYLCTKGLMHYGPRIYDEPVYASSDEHGNITIEVD